MIEPVPFLIGCLVIEAAAFGLVLWKQRLRIRRLELELWIVQRSPGGELEDATAALMRNVLRMHDQRGEPLNEGSLAKVNRRARRRNLEALKQTETEK